MDVLRVEVCQDSTIRKRKRLLAKLSSTLERRSSNHDWGLASPNGLTQELSAARLNEVLQSISHWLPKIDALALKTPQGVTDARATLKNLTAISAIPSCSGSRL